MTIFEREMHPAMPRVQCPECGGKMRLARIDPDTNPHRRADVTTFQCSCGFTYRPIIERIERRPKREE
ncbi:MAG TPA: hypothetical protein VFQ27_01555 [Xanthobacteraceae bacterium]|nr:hypothetical protein [Xanthobacteraceae bacterium]